MAQVGTALIAIGGAGNLGIRRILPKGMFNLDLPEGGLPRPVAEVLLALVHANGAALLAAAIACFYLLRLMRATGQRKLGVVIVVVLLLTDGVHAMQLHQAQHPAFGLALGLLLLVLVGLGLYNLPRAGLAPTSPAAEPRPPA
jgi:hypothetical protein